MAHGDPFLQRQHFLTVNTNAPKALSTTANPVDQDSGESARGVRPVQRDNASEVACDEPPGVREPR
jgi:hypothetical protein